MIFRSDVSKVPPLASQLRVGVLRYMEGVTPEREGRGWELAIFNHLCVPGLELGRAGSGVGGAE